MSDICRILDIEESCLKEILLLLEAQHIAIIKNDIKSMEDAAEGLIKKGIDIERAENDRKMLPREDIKDNKIDDNIRSIKRIVSEINVQKKTNMLLLKQGINFNNKIINILSPQKSSMVYDNSGKLSK